MGTVRYTVIEGEVVSELRGGVKRDYVPDPLGSTVALLDNTQTITDTFQYWPYGENAARTGTTATPFQYVGTLGYYRDGTQRIYVRARYLGIFTGRWITEDPLSVVFNENVYSYCSESPVKNFDYSGLAQYIERPGPIFGYPYTHAYIVFDEIRCIIDNKSWRTKYNPATGGYSFGFWPLHPIIGGFLLPGNINSPDPTVRNLGKHRRKKRNLDLIFEIALCACIQESAKNPPWYFFGLFGYVCGSWTTDMWECAKTKLGWNKPAVHTVTVL